MNKQELAEVVGKQLNIPPAAAAQVIGAALEAITTAVASGDEVALRGFGSFVRSRRKPRVGRNPGTGARIQLPGIDTPRFRPGAKFRAKVSGK